MPIPFSEIPEHIGISIIEKLEAYDFLKILKCSRVSYDIAKKVKKPFSLSVITFKMYRANEELAVYFSREETTEEGESNYRETRKWLRDLVHLPIRFQPICIVVPLMLTDELCRIHVNFLRAETVKRVWLEIAGGIECSTDLFNELLETANVSWMDGKNVSISPKYLLVPAISKLADLHANSRVDDDDLSQIDVPRMSLRNANISCFGINSVLQDILQSKRYMAKITLRMREDLDVDVCFNGLTYEKEETLDRGVFFHIESDEKKIRVSYYKRYRMSIQLVN